MDTEVSVGAVTYIQARGGVRYLLLFRRNSQIWEFPQGHREPDEHELQTLSREIEEETGIRRYAVVKGFKDAFVTVDRHGTTKHVAMYGIEIDEDDVVLSQEHTRFSFVTYDQAMSMLTCDGRKKVMEHFHEFMNTNLNKRFETHEAQDESHSVRQTS